VSWCTSRRRRRRRRWGALAICIIWGSAPRAFRTKCCYSAFLVDRTVRVSCALGTHYTRHEIMMNALTSPCLGSFLTNPRLYVIARYNIEVPLVQNSCQRVKHLIDLTPVLHSTSCTRSSFAIQEAFKPTVASDNFPRSPRTRGTHCDATLQKIHTSFFVFWQFAQCCSQSNGRRECDEGEKRTPLDSFLEFEQKSKTPNS